MARKPSRDPIEISMGDRSWSKAEIKKCATNLRRLERLIGGSKNKGIVTRPSGGTSTESYSFELEDPDNDLVVWKWTSQLSHDWQMGNAQPIEAFLQAVNAELKRLEPPTSTVTDIAALARKLNPEEQAQVRTILQTMTGKPSRSKKPRGKPGHHDDRDMKKRKPSTDPTSNRVIKGGPKTKAA